MAVIMRPKMKFIISSKQITSTLKMKQKFKNFGKFKTQKRPPHLSKKINRIYDFLLKSIKKAF